MAGKKPLFSADAAEEYFSTLLTYYRNTGNDIFKRDNEGRHVSDQIYSAEYQKYLGMQIAMREVLEYFAKFELGDTALRQQEAVTDRHQMTNADRIRSMTDEELVNLHYSGSAHCIASDPTACARHDFIGNLTPCEQCYLKWLQQPAGEEEA